MNWGDLLHTLKTLLPILGGLTGNPALAVLITKLINVAEDEIARRMAENPGMTRAEILQDAARAYAEAEIENEKLKRLGHENDPPV